MAENNQAFYAVRVQFCNKAALGFRRIIACKYEKFIRAFRVNPDKSVDQSGIKIVKKIRRNNADNTGFSTGKGFCKFIFGIIKCF